jgi:hypothetical protein
MVFMVYLWYRISIKLWPMLSRVSHSCTLSWIKVVSLGLGGLSFSCPGCDLIWNQYYEFVIAFLQIGQFAYPHLWYPIKSGWIVNLHLSHLLFCKICLVLFNSKYNKDVFTSSSLLGEYLFIVVVQDYIVPLFSLR